MLDATDTANTSATGILDALTGAVALSRMARLPWLLGQVHSCRQEAARLSLFFSWLTPRGRVLSTSLVRDYHASVANREEASHEDLDRVCACVLDLDRDRSRRSARDRERQRQWRLGQRLQWQPELV